MNQTLTFLSTLALIFVATGLLAQSQMATITGTVKEENSNQPVPYATVAVIELETDNILTGVTTTDDGSFSVSTDQTNVYIEISFIGFAKKTVRDLNFQNGKASLGTLLLNSDGLDLDAIEITAERSTTEFRLDKRVFNVGQDISSTGMSAMQVLNNVPSVNVSIEGEITLRGSAGVQILINGKPSVLADSQNNALGTITADMIDRIEVITNPSAKWAAEGSSGILNIILKKEEKRGLNGSISLNTGIPNNHSVGVSLNKRTENFNFFTQMGAGYRTLPRDRESINLNKLNNTAISSEGTTTRNEYFYNITLGTDYHIDKYNVITLSGNFAYDKEDHISEMNYSIIDENNTPTSQWQRNEDTQGTNPKWQYDLQYKREFKDNKKHTLLFSTLGSFFGKDQTSDFAEISVLGNPELDSQKTRTNWNRTDYTFKLDYTKPFNEKYTLEAGGQYDLNNVGNDYAVYNHAGDGIFVVDSNLTNDFQYDQGVLGGYVTGAFEGEKWGIKLGLRVETTDLKTLLINTNESNTSNYTDLFPSVHTSYKISDPFSVQAGYSRRIYRPRLWHLNPFWNITDNYNIFRGNPDLDPEYTDSYEFTGVVTFEKIAFNAGVYHLFTTDVIERIVTVDDNTSTSMPINIGTKATTGIEVNGRYTPLKWLSFNGDFNWGYFNRKGEYENQNFDFAGDSWTSRLTAKFQLPKGFDVEASGNYRSGYETVQGYMSVYTYVDLGVRKRLWNGKGIINLSVSDVFNTRVHEISIDQADYNLYSFSQRGRYITLGFTYGFGKGDAMTYSSGTRR